MFDVQVRGRLSAVACGAQQVNLCERRDLRHISHGTIDGDGLIKVFMYVSLCSVCGKCWRCMEMIVLDLQSYIAHFPNGGMGNDYSTVPKKYATVRLRLSSTR